MSDTLTVEIPLSVRDNSETVTDYAFMRHLSRDRGVRDVEQRDQLLKVYREHLSHAYDVYSWSDTNQFNGQRCRFDMVVNTKGVVVALLHTEYWTRVACSHGASGDWQCSSYATHYARIQHADGTSTTRALCDEDIRWLRRENEAVTLSDRLFIGQHN